jgi:hypothetical protein
MSKLDAVECLLSDARGQYIPRDFVANFDMTEWGLDYERDKWALDTCAAGPDEEGYWDAWDQILNEAKYTKGGNTWFLHQDGDLWALCYDLMTAEEKFNFGFDDESF